MDYTLICMDSTPKWNDQSCLSREKYGDIMINIGMKRILEKKLA